MKIDRPKENWTKYPNCILDNIHIYSPSAFKVISLMVRKNIGYEKPNKNFSLSYISLKTKMGKPTSSKAVQELLKLGSIMEVGTGARGVKLYDIVWKAPLVKNFNQLKILTSTSKDFIPELVKKFNPLLENKVKENKVKENKQKNYEKKCTSIIEYWNTKKIQKHSLDLALSNFKRKKIEISVNLVSIDEWKRTIDAYNEIVNDDKYWYRYKTQLWTFIERGHYHNFLMTEDHNPYDKYLKTENKVKIYK